MSTTSPPLVSRDPVAIPLCALPDRFHPRDGSGVLTLKAEDCRSRALSLLMLRVARCGEDAVSVEAWLPWGDAAYDENASVHCYLTMESVEILVAAEVGMEE